MAFFESHVTNAIHVLTYILRILAQILVTYSFNKTFKLNNLQD